MPTSPLNSSFPRTLHVPTELAPFSAPRKPATLAAIAPSPVIGAATPFNVSQRRWTTQCGAPLLIDSPPQIQEPGPIREMLRQHCETPESTRQILSSQQIGAWLVDLANAMPREGTVRSNVLLATDVHAMSLQLEWKTGSDGVRRIDVAVDDLHEPSFKYHEAFASTEELRAMGARLWTSSEHEATLAGTSHLRFDAPDPLQYFGAGNSVSEYSRAIGLAIARNMPQTVHALVDRMHQNELSDHDRAKAAADISLGLSTGIRFGFDVEAGAHALHRLKLPQQHLLNVACILTQELHHAMRDDRPASVLSYGRMLHALQFDKAAVLALLSAESTHLQLTPVRIALVDCDDQVSLKALRAYGAVMKLHQLAQDDVIRLMESKRKGGNVVLHDCLDELMEFINDPSVSDAELIEMARLHACVGQVFVEVLLDHDIEPACIGNILAIETMQAMSNDADKTDRTALVLQQLTAIGAGCAIRPGSRTPIAGMSR